MSAMGIPEEIARGTIRFSIGAQNTLEEIDEAADYVRENVKKLRETSAEYEDYQNKYV